jgi:predicted GIY-YIG superfamily endonuclease
LILRFGRKFFSEIPENPGVYLMRDSYDRIVYVGKAKNLRRRLRSYTHRNERNSTRKEMRLVHSIHSIEWEILVDEKSALLRENQLLRRLRPFFNVLNTSPHTYLFVHLKPEEKGIRFHVGMSEDKNYPDIYGAFKGLGVIYRSQKALLRLLWATYHSCRNGFEFPGFLTNRRRLDHFLFEYPADLDPDGQLKLYRGLKRLFAGTSKQVLLDLIDGLLLREDLASFMNHLIQEDIDMVLDFFKRCTHKNRRIKQKLKLSTALLPQDQVDDLLIQVSEKFKTG